MSEILNILGTVGFNWHVALANFFNFLIILFLLQKFFFGKLRSVIETRREVIEKGLTQASEAEKALHNAHAEKEEMLQNAKKESHSIIQSAHTEGEKTATRLTEKAQEDIAHKYTQLGEEEKNLQQKVEESFRKKAPALVASLYMKTLGEHMTEEHNNAFIAKIKVS